MIKMVIEKEQFDHLDELHRIVVEQKIRKGEWRLIEKISRTSKEDSG